MTHHAGPYEGVARELWGSPFAPIEYALETESTNADAAALLGDERFGGMSVVAEYQRRGVGRKGRAWQALPGTALLFTTILPRSIEVENLWVVPFWAALAVRSALRECGVGTTLQWPNDLLLGERKLAGILCQSRIAGPTARVACGVGINVRRLAGAEDGIEPQPAFCDDAASVERPALLRAVLRAYETSLDLLDAPAQVAEQWERAALIPGRRYRIRREGEDEAFEAVALGLDRSGGLRVTRPDGVEEAIALGDARVLR
jgi:BirA family biotin operon repressor/biotin-[acetyl-CoA-carboxylase] ligase